MPAPLIFWLFGNRKQRQLKRLRLHHDRLRSIIGDLLALANDVDEASKYQGDSADAWATDLRAACTQLVSLGDDLPEIERLLTENHLKEAQDTILESCRKATDIARALHRIRRT